MEKINTLETLIQLRRGLESDWQAVGDNYIPFPGEPCVTLSENNEDSSRIKIGDGKTPWSKLKYLDEDISEDIHGIFSAPTVEDFPAVGDKNMIYKADKEKKIYQWNTEKAEYEEISADTDGSISDITIIDGGNANG